MRLDGMRIITNPRTQHIHRVVGGSLAVLTLGGILAASGDFTVDDLDDVPISEVPLDEGTDEPSAPAPTAPPPPTTPAPAPETPPERPGTPEPPPTSAPPTTEQPAGPTGTGELEDGRHFGYLVGYDTDGTGTVARFDLARFYSGDEADAAAAEDGAIDLGAQIENDVYVRNTNARLRRIVLRDAAAVTVLDCSAGCRNVAADVATLRNRPTPTPVWVTVEDGAVVTAEEMYLP